MDIEKKVHICDNQVKAISTLMEPRTVKEIKVN